MNKFQTNGLLLMLAPIFVISSDFLVSKFTTQAAIGKFNKSNRLQVDSTAGEFPSPGPIGARYFNTKLKKYPVKRDD